MDPAELLLLKFGSSLPKHPYYVRSTHEQDLFQNYLKI